MICVAVLDTRVQNTSYQPMSHVDMMETTGAIGTQAMHSHWPVAYPRRNPRSRKPAADHALDWQWPLAWGPTMPPSFGVVVIPISLLLRFLIPALPYEYVLVKIARDNGIGMAFADRHLRVMQGLRSPSSRQETATPGWGKSNSQLRYGLVRLRTVRTT